jgi:adenylylsulfate kinase-like enzyme
VRGARRSRDSTGARAPGRDTLGFTGIDAPYEVPEAPDLVLDTTTLSVEESVAVLLPFALPEST